MIEGLTKLLPMFIMVGGGAKLASKSDVILNFTRKTAVQSEINDLAKCMQLDVIDGPQNVPSDENWPAYLRKNLKVQEGVQRDVTQDQWGRPYRLVRTEAYVLIVSDGPDRASDTSDDIRAKVSF
jgi:hypothetical protein